MTSVAVVCPACRSALDAGVESTTCSGCGSRFEVANGLPLLVDSELTTQQASQREYFDAEFRRYESYRLGSWRLSFIERIFNRLGVLEGREPYLDVGIGGSGATVIEAGRRGVEAVGCDLSVAGVLAAVRAAELEGVSDRTAFFVCAAEALPFEASSFGSASAIAVLEHLDDDRQAAAELGRVVEPGGRIWVTVPHAYRYVPPPLWPVLRWHDWRIGHKRHYDERRLVRLFESVGLEHVATLYSGHPIKVVQYAAQALFPKLRDARSPAWWRLEQIDRRREHRPLWALQLNAIFRRP